MKVKNLLSIFLLAVIAPALYLNDGAIIATITTEPVTIAVAGDIACGPKSTGWNGGDGKGSGATAKCKQKATSQVILDAAPDAVLTLGDNQYETATAAEFAAGYDPTWGRFKDITYPSAADEDWEANGGGTYFNYFSDSLGASIPEWSNPGYYSFDIGAWHIAVTNQGPTTISSAQKNWLAADLAASDKACSIVVSHLPRWSSKNKNGGFRKVDSFFNSAFNNGAELFLSGNDHVYERFTPKTPSGGTNANGVRQWIVGTGGKNQNLFSTTRPGSQVRLRSLGVLFLTLNSDSYDWKFVDYTGNVRDTGTESCHS